jgi:hypothetical protein
MKIETLIGIDCYTLSIYRDVDKLYRFCIIDFAGFVSNFERVFLTAQEAEIEGRSIVKQFFESNFPRNR